MAMRPSININRVVRDGLGRLRGRAGGWAWLLAWPFICLALAPAPLYAESEVVLDPMVIESAADPTTTAQTETVDELAGRARGSTLGDYLADFLLMDSASYGPAVGRPVVRGLDGYRVGIVQGAQGLNDLSAMSQDHAVGLSPRAAERIETLRGPASLLYGSYSGGVIRLLGREHEAALAPSGLVGQVEASMGSNGAGRSATAEASLGQRHVSLAASGHLHQADDYAAGDGETIRDSDTRTDAGHLVLGVSPTDGQSLKAYGDWLEKSYGIPNVTPAETRIEMAQQRYGLVWHAAPRSTWMRHAQTEFQYSHYRHDETEGGREDGLFGQDQYGLTSGLEFVWRPWVLQTQWSYQHNRLQVCHEHGKCQDFSRAERTAVPDGASLLGYLESTGIPFAHGHPMPDTIEQQLAAAANLQYLGRADEFSLGLRTTWRHLDPDPRNVQETWLVPTALDPDYYAVARDLAMSAMLGWRHDVTAAWLLDASIGYLERLPAAQELFWNGFHHATDSYILGDRDLKNERSLNLDLAIGGEYGPWRTRLEAYFYRFFRYIYQAPRVTETGEPLQDPFHSSPVWALTSVAARVYGLAWAQDYTQALGAGEWHAGMRLEALRGVADSGANLPRMMPYTAGVHLGYAWSPWQARIAYERVDHSRHEAANETPTEGYDWLSASLAWTPQTPLGELSLQLKGENLTDSLARNHLSFLKATAPLPGRQVSLALRWRP